MEAEIRVYTPVIIPTLCRYTHFKRCLESLARCTGAEYTEVYIGLDYPAKEEHWSGYKKIRDYLETCGNLGFKKLIVIRRERNYGLGVNGNHSQLMNLVFSKYDRLISSEDDNEFSPCFLEYMNKGLELYKDDDSIYSITGYAHPINLGDYEYNFYIHYAACAWGIGLWRNKRMSLEKFKTSHSPKQIILSHDIWKILSTEFFLVLPLLVMSCKQVIYGDYYIEIYCVLTGKSNIVPFIRKTRNWGFDGSGVHCGAVKNNDYIKLPIDEERHFEFDDINDVKSKTKQVNLSVMKYRRKGYNFVSYLKLIKYFLGFVMFVIKDKHS